MHRSSLVTLERVQRSLCPLHAWREEGQKHALVVQSLLVCCVAGSCAKDRPHSSWAPRLVNGKPSFPTAEEAAYPHLLCKRIACLVMQGGGPLSIPQSLHGPSSAITRLVWKKTSRRFAALVPEYSQFDHWAVPLEQQQRAAQILKCYSKGARVCERRLCLWGQVRACVLPRVSFGVLRQQLGPSWSWCQQPDDPESQALPDSDTSVVCGMCLPSNFVETAEILVIGRPRFSLRRR